MPEGEKITKSILDLTTRPIISHFEKTDEQIGQTKKSFTLPTSCGVLELLNGLNTTVQQIILQSDQQIEVDAHGIATGGNVDLAALTTGNDVMRASA